MSVLVSFFALLLPAYGFAIYLGKVEFQDSCKINGSIHVVESSNN
jgi:hypothetical protein